MDIFYNFLETTGFSQMNWGNAIMIVIGLIFIGLAIIKDYETLLFLPIVFGVIVGNIPTIASMALSVYDEGGMVL